MINLKQPLETVLFNAIQESNIGMIITDAKGKTVWINEYIRNVTGFRLEDFIGKPPGALLQGPKTNPEHIEAISEGLKSGKRFETEILNYSKLGKEIWINLEIIPLFDDKKAISNFVGIQTDVSHLKAQNKRLQNFNFTISHNLSNQVNNVSNLVRLINSNSEIPEDDLFELITESTTKLVNSVIGLREILKLENESNSIVFQEIQLKLFLDGIVSSELGENKSVLEVSNLIPEHLKIKSSYHYLESIFRNLISNALKYRDPNKRSFLQISSEEHADYLTFFLKDNGIGIDMDSASDKVFHIFETLQKVPGALGIGLYYAKNQVESLNGSISYESELGIGTTFMIRLPTLAPPNVQNKL